MFVAEMEGRVYRWPQGVRDWLANVEETFDAFSSEVAAIEELGDRASRWTWDRTLEEALAAAEEGE